MCKGFRRFRFVENHFRPNFPLERLENTTSIFRKIIFYESIIYEVYESRFFS